MQGLQGLQGVNVRRSPRVWGPTPVKAPLGQEMEARAAPGHPGLQRGHGRQGREGDTVLSTTLHGSPWYAMEG